MNALKKESKKVITGMLVLALGFMGLKAWQPKTMPLVPMMRLLLNDMEMVNEGIYTEDYELIEKGALKIADHPVMTEKDKQRVKTTLGSEMQKFVDYDRSVHHHADSIGQAARRQNMQEVLRHYRIVQQGCVNCHSDFRSQIMEAGK